MIDDNLVLPAHGAVADPVTGARSLSRSRSSTSSAAAFLAGGYWGWLPVLSLLGAVGLVLVAIADTGARNNARWAEALFWAGLLIVYAPTTTRLCAAATGRHERGWLVAILGLELYLVKVLHSPLAFTDHDEFLHWRTVENILASNHLFGSNPLLPASAVFPGLETVTTALMHLSGLPMFVAGVLVVGVARLVLVIALYLFFEQAAGSSRVAGIAAALYMGNPNYLFFNALFKYESLALAFAALALFALIRREKAGAAQRTGLTVVAVLALAGMVITHHLTSYVLTAFLAVWTLIGLLRNRGKPNRAGPGWIMLLLLVANLAWLVFVARITIPYLEPVFGNAANEAVDLLTHHGHAGRQLFQYTGGYASPLWERAMTIAAVGMILLGLPLGLWQVWRRRRFDAIIITLALIAAMYPFTLALRLTTAGWQISNRSSEYLFVGIGLILALGITELKRWRALDWRGPLAVTACASVIFVGGFIEGWPSLLRLPGPYLPAQDTRSIEPQGVSAALWTRSYLGPHNRIGTDRINDLLMGTYGDQDVSSTLNGGINANWILFAPKIDANLTTFMQKGHLRYVVVDRRLIRAPEVAKPYYPATSIAAAFAKFDRTRNLSRVFDSGDIQIYDMRGLSDHR